MANVTLRNDFHNSECTIRTEVLSHIYHTSTVYPTRSQIETANRKLCGIQGCTCGGIRGPQEYRGKRLIVDDSKAIQ